MPGDDALWAIQRAFATYVSHVVAPLALILAGCLLLLVFLDDRIVVSRQGLVLPLSLCVQFYCHRNRLWSELKKSVLIKKEGRNVCLKLNFTDGNFVVFEADEMSEDDLNKLLIASRTLAPKDERDRDELSDSTNFANTAKPGNQIPLDISTFTSLWESELTARFRATTYVPLLPGRVLNTGIIIVKALSYGGSSAIYLASRQNGTPVVLKEFVVADSLNAEAREKALTMFKKEARLLSKLEHKRHCQNLRSLRGRRALLHDLGVHSRRGFETAGSKTRTDFGKRVSPVDATNFDCAQILRTAITTRGASRSDTGKYCFPPARKSCRHRLRSCQRIHRYGNRHGG